MERLDWIVVCGYLLGLLALAVYLGRKQRHKCLQKGFEWFEARDYDNPGNLAGCMIHKTETGGAPASRLASTRVEGFFS